MRTLRAYSSSKLLIINICGISVAMIVILLLSNPLQAADRSMYSSQTPEPTTSTVNSISEELIDRISDEKCVFPCWLGWHLGENTLAQVLEKFEGLSDEERPYAIDRQDDYTLVAAAFDFPGQKEDDEPYLGFIFFIKNETDTLVGVQTEINLAVSPPINEAVFLPYNLANEYGVPTNIIFQVRTPSTRSPWYTLTLQYKSPYLLIQYRGDLNFLENDGSVRVCVEDSTSYIISWVQVEEVPSMTPSRRMLEDEEILERGRVEVKDSDLINIFAEENACFSTAPWN